MQGFLPGLALKLFFHFLPDFLLLITKVEGHFAISRIERRAAAKYYYFVVVNIFFGSMLTGSAFQQLKTFVTSASFLGFVHEYTFYIPKDLKRPNFNVVFLGLTMIHIMAKVLINKYS